MTHVTPQYLAEQGFNSTFPARFFSKIQFTDSCWLWTAWKLPRGYGLIGRGGRGQGMELAHRASWILHFGAIPDGLDVCHDCPDGDNPSCVNPAHLWIGDRCQNMMDCSRKGMGLGPPIGKYIGARNPNARFTDDEAEQIRQAYYPKRGIMKELAIRFGADRNTVSRIIHGKRYVYA